MPNVQRIAVVAPDGVFVPTFYVYPRVPVLVVSTDTTSSSWSDLASFRPSHVVFFDRSSFDVMRTKVSRVIGATVVEVQSIEPGLLDRTLHVLNPSGNKNEVSTLCTVRL
jgi:hypothetical protein